MTIDDTRVKRLAEGLLKLAELAMPDTYFRTDSRCVLARKVLKELETTKVIRGPKARRHK